MNWLTQFSLFFIRLYFLYINKDKKKFLFALHNLEKTQRATLNSILLNHEKSIWGKKYSIHSNDSAELFAKKVPLQSYDSLHDSILKNELFDSNDTNQKVLFFEETSGSSAKKKEIPMTKSLLHSFRCLVNIWFSDLFEIIPKLKYGKIYFSISPPPFLKDSQTTKKLIKLDTEYMNLPLRIIFNYFSAVPLSVRNVQNPNDFLYLTSIFLASNPKLEVISIWSPSFLNRIISFIETHRNKLAHDMNLGQVTIENRTYKLPRQSKSQVQLLNEKDISFNKLWPHLKLISAWSSGPSENEFLLLKSRFQNVLFQGKGLLATEAPMTVPLHKFEMFYPLITEVYFECRDSTGNIFPLWQCLHNQIYELIITQKSGLVRYQMKDLVKIQHDPDNCITMEFVGRTLTSDLVGEKLDSVFISHQMNNVFNAGENYLFLPLQQRSEYIILHQKPLNLSVEQIEDFLFESYHYKLARQLGQLNPLKSLICPNLANKYLDFFTNKGTQLGSIKNSLLITDPKLANEFYEFIYTSQTSVSADL